VIGDQRQAIRCPRCGYDQRGAVAAWDDSCPLVGTCAECGLEFSWPEIIWPEKHEAKWCIEFAPAGSTIAVAGVNTFLHSFQPWGFWSRIRMSNRIRWGRLAIYVNALILVLAFCYVLLQGGVAIYVRYQMQQHFLQEYQSIASQIGWSQISLQKIQSQNSGSPKDIQQLQAMLADLRQRQAAGPLSVSHSYPAAVYEAVVFPFSSSSSGTVALAYSRTGRYIPPNYLWQEARYFSASAPTGGQLYAADWWDQIGLYLPRLAFGIAIFVLVPLSLILLPISRKNAKVRWAHVVRAALYGLFIPITLVSVGTGLFVLGYVVPRLAGSCQLCLVALSRWAMLVMVIAWWSAVISRYLCIPRGMIVSCVLGALSFLLVVATCWFVWPRFAADTIAPFF